VLTIRHAHADSSIEFFNIVTKDFRLLARAGRRSRDSTGLCAGQYLLDGCDHERIGRLDRDVAERRGAAERLIDAFAAGALDVLVGTSLVTKGLDIPADAMRAVLHDNAARVLGL